MKATIKVEFSEQSRVVTGHSKIEITGDVEREDQLTDLIKLVKAEAKDLASWTLSQSQSLSIRK